jgi:hypothetical protein
LSCTKSYEDLKCQGKLFESVEELYGILNNEYGYDINPNEIIKTLKFKNEY